MLAEATASDGLCPLILPKQVVTESPAGIPVTEGRPRTIPNDTTVLAGLLLLVRMTGLLARPPSTLLGS